MSNNTSKTIGKLSYAWNPFQDNESNRITGETVHVESGTTAPIIIPRSGPIFSKNFKITLNGSGRELSFEAGDYSFLYPFGSFIKKYNRLVWGGIAINNVSTASDFTIEYDTIGSGFVLDEIGYAAAVANTLINPRVVDWDVLINLDTTFPADPHDHPASDTLNYGDLITWMKSYLDATMNNDSSFTVQTALTKHLNAPLNEAHSGTLADLGIKNLKDWAMAQETDLVGNSTEHLMNVWGVKELIRQYAKGQWS